MALISKPEGKHSLDMRSKIFLPRAQPELELACVGALAEYHCRRQSESFEEYTKPALSETLNK